ncbi:MAG: ankyrin repeat domain-containing protein [Anaerolineales bacterium]
MSATFEPKQELVDQFVGSAHGDFDTVKTLLAQNPAILNRSASWGEVALGAAAQTGSVAIAQHLLDAGAPQDICTAAMLGRLETVAAMLPDEPAGANATGAHGIPLLYHAVIGGHADIAEMLLAQGADINAGAGGSPALHGAIAFGRAGLAEWLLHHGADPNILNHENQTPVAAALARNKPELAELLQAHGGH